MKIKKFLQENKNKLIVILGITGVGLGIVLTMKRSNYDNYEKVDIFVGPSELKDMVTDIWIKKQGSKEPFCVSLNREDSVDFAKIIENMLS